MTEASTASRPVRTTDVVRRRNLARVLRLVHEGGPMPRSALTRETGLNRSTVAALVGELVELGLVVEGGTRRPRPASAVRARPCRRPPRSSPSRSSPRSTPSRWP
ncbi:helix-turn-helix domain-containing protein [Curtobacterium sp. MCJR17_043]|uniref:MarR family transcriptional regulator n=1 Tax=Curtobacterium sp. MCJR17_043 TaxID=2175660 RepID=UPI0024DFF9D2|nr:helix-turn-helix domain-containing protein [Curtobacterium sp. MCJR17_043]WIB36269.1 helix-turn-helix domain-containing protein [Curtobacterium sp. MCJR17_043]